MENNGVRDNTLRKLSKLVKRPPVNIEFQDLIYSVKDGAQKSGKKQILKSLNGIFRSGELTAILGPSGSGKTTLLNILAGYVSQGVTGSITINDKPRDMKIFHKLSSYIMQEDLVQPRLSVQEAMMVAANLKVESHVSLKEKQYIVEEVVRVLGLQNCLSLRTERLSRSQIKRLSIALELVNNPPIIFMDEPTTGFDNVAITQCIDVLKTLVKQGRTIICTIHQPPASLFHQFDQVYFIAEGECVYNGCTQNIISHLSTTGFACPTSYNPADYLVELVNINPDSIPLFKATTKNGKINNKMEQFTDITDTIDQLYCEKIQLDETKISVNFATSFWKQFYILLARMFLQVSRNKIMLVIQLLHHVGTGLLLGILYFGKGNDAQSANANVRLCLGIMTFFMYTHVMVPVLIFPMELQVLKREYSNRWYGLKSFYAALMMRNLPLMIILGVVFVVITYFMSAQPQDFDSFIRFTGISLLLAIASEGLGTTIGCIFSTRDGAAVAPAILAPMMALSLYGMGYGTTHPFMVFLMSLDYLRYSMVGLCLSLYGGDRPPFDCEDDIYCHYKDKKLLLRDIGMADSVFSTQIVALVAFIFLYRILGFMVLRLKLTSDYPQRVMNQFMRLVKCK